MHEKTHILSNNVGLLGIYPSNVQFIYIKTGLLNLTVVP